MEFIRLFCRRLFASLALRFAPSSMNFLAMTHGHAAGQKGADPKKCLSLEDVGFCRCADGGIGVGGVWGLGPNLSR